MVDLKLLEKTIRDSGLKAGSIGDTLGIGYASFWRKMHGITEFKASEMSALKDMMHMSNTLFRRIFFASVRECEATKKQLESS